MAALVFVGAMTAGCSGDDLTAETPQLPDTTNGTVVTKVTVSLDEHASTRMLDPTGLKTFEEGDKIAVIYKNTAGVTVKAESDPLQATDLHDAKKTASFSVTLTNPQANTPVRYIYPAAMAVATIATDAAIDDASTIDYTKLATQDGTLTKLGSDFDLAVFDGTMTAQAVLPAAELANPLTLVKFSIKSVDLGNITNTVTSLTINDGTNIYNVNPSALDAIFVAMKPTNGNIAFTATTSDSETYFKTVTEKTLDAGKFYTINLSMLHLTVGNILCSDGSVYISTEAAEGAGKTPIAKICYIGNDAETNTTFKHGLALALSDANGGSETAWCSQKIATCLGSGSQYDSETAAKGDMAGIDNTDYLITHVPEGHNHSAASAARNYNSGTHPIGTSEWFLPSAGQWDKMVTAAGGYSTLVTNAGLHTTYYWSSTELSDDSAFRYSFYIDIWYPWYKPTPHYVRSALAF